MKLVEIAAAAPAAKGSWLTDLRNSVRSLEVALSSHIVEVESPQGLLDRIVDQAPRLQRSVAATREEHAEIVNAITNALAMMDTDDEGVGRGQIREAVMEVLLALARHRQRGADLVYDAYDIDIGGY
jgi:hypothetical protein